MGRLDIGDKWRDEDYWPPFEEDYSIEAPPAHCRSKLTYRSVLCTSVTALIVAALIVVASIL